jgi:probable addiction module antidote protein
MTTVSYHETLIKDFQKNPQDVLYYLNAAIEEDDPRVFFIALQNVAEAQGNDLSKLAKKAKLSQKKIAEALAGKNHPELYKIDLLLQTLGYRLTIQKQA